MGDSCRLKQYIEKMTEFLSLYLAERELVGGKQMINQTCQLVRVLLVRDQRQAQNPALVASLHHF